MKDQTRPVTQTDPSTRTPPGYAGPAIDMTITSAIERGGQGLAAMRLAGAKRTSSNLALVIDGGITRSAQSSALRSVLSRALSAGRRNGVSTWITTTRATKSLHDQAGVAK
jgi:hypothetical protein